jgi:hypothetical protein
LEYVKREFFNRQKGCTIHARMSCDLRLAFRGMYDPGRKRAILSIDGCGLTVEMKIALLA